MKIVLEPSQCRRLLENVLLYHGGAELDSNVGVFTPEKVEFQDIGLEVVGVYASYDRAFFINYEAGDESVPLSKSLLEQMRRGFGVDEHVTLWTEADKIHLEGKGERYEEPITEVPPSEFPISFKEDPTVGLVPKSLEAKVQVRVGANILASLPKAENYLFKCNGERLEAVASDVGTYTREIVPIEENEMNELEVVFEAGYFSKVSNQFDDDVWLSLSEDSAVFSQKKDSFMLTYMLGSL